MTKLTTIEGIGEIYADKLRTAGVATVETLLKTGATPKGRQELQEKTGIDIEFADTPCLMPAFGEDDEKLLKDLVSMAQGKVKESKGYCY
jgi:hypothetical protein